MKRKKQIGKRNGKQNRRRDEIMSMKEFMQEFKRVVKWHVGKNYTTKGLERCLQADNYSLAVVGSVLALLNSDEARSKCWKKLRDWLIRDHRDLIDQLSALDGEKKKTQIKVTDSPIIILVFGLLCRLGLIPELTVENQYLFLTRCFDLDYKESSVKQMLTNINTSSPLYKALVDEIIRLKNIRPSDIRDR